MSTNPALFDYGIHTEDSDIRAHVSVVNKTVYVFPTRNGIDAIIEHNPQLRPAFQPGCEYITAEGWLIKPEWIKDIRELKFLSWPEWTRFSQELSTSEKGCLAVKCVVSLIQKGRFPFWIEAQESVSKNIQILGTDIIVACKKKIQVKCDYRAGQKPNGSGNLFLQKSEINPFKRH